MLTNELRTRIVTLSTPPQQRRTGAARLQEAKPRLRQHGRSRRGCCRGQRDQSREVGGAVAGCPAPDPNNKTLTLLLIDSPSADAIKSFIPAWEKKTGIKVNVTSYDYNV